jgi:hypothetical protein
MKTQKNSYKNKPFSFTFVCQLNTMPFSQIKKYYFDLVPSLTHEIWQEMEPNASFDTYKKGENYIVPGQMEIMFHLLIKVVLDILWCRMTENKFVILFLKMSIFQNMAVL